MPQKSENFPPNWDDIDDECHHIPLNCPWTITSENETLTVVSTFLKCSFNYDFWIRVAAHPEGNPNISKQIDNNKHNPLLESLSEALNDYEDFSELHLNSHQLHILEELLDSLFSRYNPHNGQYSSCLSWRSHRQILRHRSRSARRIFHLNRKINFAHGDAGDLTNYTFKKKALFSSLLRGPAAEWYENNITNATTWEIVRTNFITRFSDGRNKFRYRMEV